jgi:23S rRNA (cytosine1962-C5)-methyltransferase
MQLHLASGGQIGLFPEHIACWNWLRSTLHGIPPGTAMLNLFAATGGASLAAAHSGASVTHIDAQQSALKQAARNCADTPIRLIREDVQRFVERALRRGQHYPLMVLDPPSFGRGPKGQTWDINRDLPTLVATLAELIGPAPLGLWLSTHSNGWDPTALAQLLADNFAGADIQAFPLAIASIDGRQLASGSAATARWPTADNGQAATADHHQRQN